MKRATVSGGPYSTIASPTTAGYTDIAVTGGTSYYYVVSAVNSFGESADSTEVNVTPSVGASATAIETFDGYANGSSIGSGTMNGGAGWTGAWQYNHTGTQISDQRRAELHGGKSGGLALLCLARFNRGQYHLLFSGRLWFECAGSIGFLGMRADGWFGS